MSADVQKIEYAALQHECRRLDEQKYGNEIFLEQIKDDIKRLNEKIDDLMIIIEDNMKDTPTLQDIESIYQTV